jgi:ABC-type bacteriocin/lantibiotic exporter with double-glycine peptidase domain
VNLYAKQRVPNLFFHHSDINAIEQGIGDILSISIQLIASFPAGLIIGFIYAWDLSLVVLSSTPIFLAISVFVVWVSLL